MLRFFLILAVLLCPLQARAQHSGFAPGLEDLPLMAGLFPIAGSPLRFDSPGGRIVVIYAEGRGSRAAIAGFYRQTLGPLGWESLEALLFRRDSETLRIEVDDTPPVTRVRFFLAPTKP